MSVRLGAVIAAQAQELRYEPTAKRVRAILAGSVVVDSRRALLVWEPGVPVPSYAVPREDIAAQVGESTLPGEGHGVPGTPVVIAVEGGRQAGGFVCEDPDLAGHVLLAFRDFDAWLEEDEEIHGHPRDPFHRVDLRRTSRRIRVALDGHTLADTVRGALLFETSLPTRYYIPKADVVPELVPSATHTICPYKGEASYWSFAAGGRVFEDLVWSYENPLVDAGPLEGLVAFYDEKFDVTVEDPAPGASVSSEPLEGRE